MQHGQIVTCTPDQLRPHPSYIRHQLTLSTDRLSALVAMGDLAFRDPLLITRDRLIIDGYARWELARKHSRPILRCIELDLSEADALHWLLQRHRRCAGLNDYCRILLALDLEPSLKEKARANQQVGGQNKVSSKLTEAERLDVRSEIAAAAGVSVGNVTKVRQLMTTAHPEVLQALREGEIRIHRAWQWSKLSPEQQREALRLYQSERGVKKTIRTLVSRHRSRSSPTVPDLSSLTVADLGRLVGRLSAIEFSTPVSVAVIRAPGRTVFLTEELVRALRSQEELPLTCATNSR